MERWKAYRIEYVCYRRLSEVRFPAGEGMLALSRKCDYGFIALSHLARFPESVTSAREISDRYQIPLPLLMNILKQFTRKGIVASVRGARGGYRLAVPPSELSVKDMVLVLEGPVRLVRCADAADDESPCERMRWCPVRGSALKRHERLAQFLEQVSLADIIEAPIQRESTGDEPSEEFVDEPSIPGLRSHHAG